MAVDAEGPCEAVAHGGREVRDERFSWGLGGLENVASDALCS